MAKHRAPRFARTRRVVSTGVVAAGATAVGLGVLSSPAQAAPTHDWSGVAQCESSGNWSINNGNGFYGGLQFTQSTWAGYGGTAFAPRADLATPCQQVAIAEKVLAGQGVGAWPVCGKHLTGGTTSAAQAVAPQAASPAPTARAAAPKHAAPETAPAPRPAAAPSTAPRHAAPESTAGSSYTVQPGDTLSTIAANQRVAGGWQTLWQDNRNVVSDPDLIFPGEVLTV
jgi:LysM repeat protein